MAKVPHRLAPTARLSDAALPALVPDSPLWPGRSVQVDGHEIFVRRAPSARQDAEPALLLHGLGGSSTNWTDFAALIASRVDVEAIDLPGFGRSGPARGDDYSMRALADAVIAYLEASGRGPVHVVGNSMGGVISVDVAARRPDLVRTLTLISPAVPDVRLRVHPVRHNPRIALAVVPGLAEYGIKKMVRFPVEPQVRGTIGLCFADARRYPSARLAQDIEETLARRELPWAGKALLRATRALARTQFLWWRSMWAAMGTITAPTLVLWGDADRLVAPDLAGFVAAAVPDSRVLTFAGVGHVAMMEVPEQSARAFLALVEDTEGARDPGGYGAADMAT